MSTASPLNVVFQQLENVELIEFINQLVPIRNEELLDQIKESFIERGFNYQHLLYQNQLQLNQPLRLIDGNLFELKIPKPPMIGPFYKILNELRIFLNEHPELKGKRKVTFDYILDQFFLSEQDVKIIQEDDLKFLKENDIFIAFRNQVQTFPNEEIRKQISHLPLQIIIDKGPFYRGLQKATVYRNNEVIAIWEK